MSRKINLNFVSNLIILPKNIPIQKYKKPDFYETETRKSTLKFADKTQNPVLFAYFLFHIKGQVKVQQPKQKFVAFFIHVDEIRGRYKKLSPTELSFFKDL